MKVPLPGSQPSPAYQPSNNDQQDDSQVAHKESDNEPEPAVAVPAAPHTGPLTHANLPLLDIPPSAWAEIHALFLEQKEKPAEKPSAPILNLPSSAIEPLLTAATNPDPPPPPVVSPHIPKAFGDALKSVEKPVVFANKFKTAGDALKGEEKPVVSPHIPNAFGEALAASRPADK